MASTRTKSITGWDGWVLYTSEDGHKYHWNHLTHESRWATEEIPDRQAEEYFHDYIRKQLSFVHPADHHVNGSSGVTVDEDVEQGHEDDVDTVPGGSSDKEPRYDTLVTPYAGIGPINAIGTSRCQSCEPRGSRDNTAEDAFAARLVGAIRRAIAIASHRPKSRYPDGVNAADAGAWDLELGEQQHRSRCEANKAKNSQSGTSTSGGSSTSTSTSGSNSRDSDCESSSDSTSSSYDEETQSLQSKKRDVRNYSDRKKRHVQARRKERCSSTTQREHGKRSLTEGQQWSLHGRVDQSSPREKQPQTSNGYSRASKAGYSHGKVMERSQRRKKAATAAAVSSSISEGLTGVGRQAVARVFNIAARAVAGGWTGMTKAALKIARNWQLHVAQDGHVLPTTANRNKDSTSKESGQEFRGESTSASHGDDDREPNRLLSWSTLLPPQPTSERHASLLPAPSWTSSSFKSRAATIHKGVHGDGALVEGFGEEDCDGERGSWVGGDNGYTDTAQEKGTSVFPPKPPSDESRAVDRLI